MGPGKAKDWDGANVLGPCIATPTSSTAPTSRSAARHGDERTRGASSEMHHLFGDLIAYASQDTTLRPAK